MGIYTRHYRPYIFPYQENCQIVFAGSQKAVEIEWTFIKEPYNFFSVSGHDVDLGEKKLSLFDVGANHACEYARFFEFMKSCAHSGLRDFQTF
jgi:hypothetical protein